jgi:hypothetical protein
MGELFDAAAGHLERSNDREALDMAKRISGLDLSRLEPDQADRLATAIHDAATEMLARDPAWLTSVVKALDQRVRIPRKSGSLRIAVPVPAGIQTWALSDETIREIVSRTASALPDADPPVAFIGGKQISLYHYRRDPRVAAAMSGVVGDLLDERTRPQRTADDAVAEELDTLRALEGALDAPELSRES